MTTQQLDVTDNWDSIRCHLPAEYEEKARELKQLQLQYGNAKVRTPLAPSQSVGVAMM
jgi:hypothetical protein